MQTGSSTATRRLAGRRGPRILAAAVALVAALLLVACTPPTLPDPMVRPQPAGRGIDPGAASAPSSGCTGGGPTAPPVGRSVLHLLWAGGTRTALVQVPDLDGLAPMPLLLSLHPFSLDPGAWEDLSGLADAAVARGYVAVSPLGSQPGLRWAVPGGLDAGVDDIGFLSALVDHLEDALCIERNREFTAGYSAGAAMAQALSCTMPWRFAAVAGSGGANLTALCPDSPPTDVFLLHGTSDGVAPVSGSQVVFATPLGLHIDTVVATDAARAGCDPTPATSAPYPDIEALDHTGCDDDHRIRYWRMLGAGHTWAGATPGLLDLLVGPTSRTFSATEAVLDFFDAA